MFAVPSFFGFQKAGFGPTIDPDAQAFFDRVTAAGGTLSATEQTATNQLVLDMKAAGIWTAMRAVYPMVGASAAACAQNLKSSSFTGTFSSGWTFASTGVTGNGTSAYFDSNCNANGFSSLHYSYYSRTSNTSGREMGVETTQGWDLIISLGGTIYGRFGSSSISTGNSDSQGFYLNTEAPALLHTLFKNNTSLGSTSFFGAYQNYNIFLGAINRNGSADYFSSKQCAFASIGDGLTDTQAGNFYTAVQAFQTTLARNV
jgi:hypothetical protein